MQRRITEAYHGFFQSVLRLFILYEAHYLSVDQGSFFTPLFDPTNNKDQPAL